MAAAHHLADNYSTVLGACYFDADGEEQCIAQMGAGLQVRRGSWSLHACARMQQSLRHACSEHACLPCGVSPTCRPPPLRLQASALSALALVHGDDAGLRLPADLAPVQVRCAGALGWHLPAAPRLGLLFQRSPPAPPAAPPLADPPHRRALPPQVAIVPCWYGGAAAKAALLEEAERLRRVLAAAGIRATVDARRTRPGVRFGAADRAGVPLRLELGARDVAARTCTLVPRRLAPGAPGFASQPAERQAGVSTEGGDALVDAVRDLLDEAQGELRWGAAAALEESIVDVSSFLELRVSLLCSFAAQAGLGSGQRRHAASATEHTAPRGLPAY